MRKVFEFDDTILLSTKDVDRAESSRVWFRDGSFANLEDRTCINKGTGEIRFEYADDELVADTATRDFSCDYRDRLVLEGGDLHVTVCESDTERVRVRLTGSQQFVADTEVRDTGESVRVTRPISRESATVMIVNGKRVGPPAQGQIAVHMPRCRSLRLETSGASRVVIESAVASLDVAIGGAGSVRCREAGSVKIDIRGSGDVRIEHATAACEIDVSGSGDVCIASGSFPELRARVAGSGSVLACISVRTASLELSGSGSILVGHVAEESRETHVGSGAIAILKRG